MGRVQGQKFEIILANMMKPSLLKVQKLAGRIGTSLVVSAVLEAEAEESLEPRRQSLQ